MDGENVKADAAAAAFLAVVLLVLLPLFLLAIVDGRLEIDLANRHPLHTRS